MVRKAAERILSALLAAILCISLSFQAFASDATVSVTLDKPSVAADEEAQTVRMTVKTDAPIKACAIGFTVSVPEGLELAGIENNCESITFSAGDVNLENGKVSWMDGALRDLETDEIATVVIRVPAGTPESVYKIRITDLKVLAEYGMKNVIDEKELESELEVVGPGAVEPGYIVGDADGDGKVDSRDAVELFLHVAGVPSEADESVLDVNEDGVVDGWDALMLFRIVSGQDTAPVSGDARPVKCGIVALYSAAGRMTGICVLGGNTHGAEIEEKLGAASQLRVFYLSDSFGPAAEQSLIRLGTEYSSR